MNRHRRLDPWAAAGHERALCFDLLCDRLVRLTRRDGAAVETPVACEAVPPGVYRCEAQGRPPRYLEMHRDRLPHLTVLWVNSDPGIATASARARATLDAAPEELLPALPQGTVPATNQPTNHPEVPTMTATATPTKAPTKTSFEKSHAALLAEANSTRKFMREVEAKKPQSPAAKKAREAHNAAWREYVKSLALGKANGWIEARPRTMAGTAPVTPAPAPAAAKEAPAPKAAKGDAVARAAERRAAAKQAASDAPIGISMSEAAAAAGARAARPISPAPKPAPKGRRKAAPATQTEGGGDASSVDPLPPAEGATEAAEAPRLTDGTYLGPLTPWRVYLYTHRRDGTPDVIEGAQTRAEAERVLRERYAEEPAFIRAEVRQGYRLRASYGRMPGGRPRLTHEMAEAK